MTRWFGACGGLLLLCITTLGVPGAEPKRVLLVESFGSSVPPFSIGATTFETALSGAMGKTVDIDEVTLEMARSQRPDLHEVFLEVAFVEFLKKRDAEWKPDLVVTIGAPAGRFVVKYRNDLFPQTPVLYSSMDWQILDKLDALKTNAAYVGTKLDIAGFVQDILQLAPDTTNLVVVIGASPLEQLWADRFRDGLASYTNRTHLTFLNNLSFEEVQKQVARLPPHSFIFLPLMIEDVEGAAHTEGETLQRLHAVANTPVNAIWQDHLGAGIVGGRLYDLETIGVQTARVAERILNGEPASAIPPWIQPAGEPRYDWRELQRWHIPESRLPAGSIIQFHQPGVWERYRWPITGTVALILLQSALVASLVVSRSRRRQGEAEATLIADISSRFVNLPSVEVDHEIEVAQRQICEFLGLDLSSLWQRNDETPGTFKLTHVYSVQKTPHTPGQLSHERFPWVAQQMLAGRVLALASLDELPAEAVRDREMARQIGIKSSLTIPLSLGGEPPIGAFGFNTTREEREWPDLLVKRLQLVAQIFANALERKRADQARRESEERMTLAAEAAQFGVWGWNVATNQVWGSERWLRLFGFVSGEDVNFEKVFQRIHPDDRERVERELRSVLGKGDRYQGDFRVVLPDGAQRWIVSRGRGYPDESGKPVRMLGAAIDITERKRAQEEIMKFQLQNELILNSAAEGIMGLDLQGNHLFVNPAAARMLGYTAEELFGRHSHSTWHHTRPDGRPYPVEECKIYAAYADGKVHRVSNEVFWRKDGTSFPVEYVSTPICQEGRLVGAVVTFEDITERKRAEAALRGLNRRLIRAQEEERARLARELHDDVTQRLARLAIDAGSVGRRADGASATDTMRSIRDGLVQLSEDIHALSYRLHPAVLEDLGLNEALKAECERFSRQERISVNVKFDPVLPVIPHETALCLFRVTQEALRNVVRHAKARAVTVSLRALDGGLQLVVHDDGAGFDPVLQREHPSLGLASMRERVSLLDGEFDIETAPGQGVTILVWVPLKKGQS